jgi:hypothetical protein
VSAHGIGGAKDLPIPAEYALAGASAALAVSFIVLALAWRTPRFDADTLGRPVPDWFARLVGGLCFRGTVRAVGFAFFAYVAFSAIAGPDLVINPVFGVVFVWLWVGVVFAWLLVAPFYRAVNPVRTLHLAVARRPGAIRAAAWSPCRPGRHVARGGRTLRVRVAGDVLGVIASHDRAIKLLPKRHQLSGQLPLLLVMVFYTATGLYLLFGA